MRPLRFGLIGLGIHGMRYAHHIMEDVVMAELVAVSRRDAARGEDFADRHGLRYYEDPAGIVMDSNVDAVVVVTPPDSHMSICLEALKADKDVIVEKPMALTAEQARRVAGAVEDCGRKLMVAQTFRYNPVAEEVRRALPKLGGVRFMRAYMRLEAADLPWHNAPETAGGGVMIDLGVHLFDLVRHLSGREIASIECRCDKIRNRHVEDFFTATIQLSGMDGVVIVDANRIAEVRSGGIEVVGEEGEIRGNFYTGVLEEIIDGEHRSVDTSTGTSGIVRVLEDFINAVDSGGEVTITADDGVKSLEAVEAGYRSAAIGEGVTTLEVAS
ncbi:Gfo/Idh/MocA family protein [Thermodesulfobacteriota bacterium]